jgi:hypothetical protein
MNLEKRNKLIKKISDDFYNHGIFSNTLNIFHMILKIKEQLEIYQCTIDELEEGLKLCLHNSIDNVEFNIPPFTFR